MNKSLVLGAAATLLASCTTTETDRDLFTQADSYKDGKLALEEVNELGFPRLFNRFDGNRDGFVTLPEARKLEPDFDAKRFTERDLDLDGKVSIKEYLTVARSRGGLKHAFSEVDANNDGIIDQGEAEAHVNRLEHRVTAR